MGLVFFWFYFLERVFGIYSIFELSYSFGEGFEVNVVEKDLDWFVEKMERIRGIVGVWYLFLEEWVYIFVKIKRIII